MERGEVSGVGIFSRSGENDYRWLLNSLKEDFPVYIFHITNNNNLQFQQEVQRRRFVILYHTKNRGRVNITNVTDSLYDEEINVMSNIHGRDRVIVVIDDLDDSSDDAKTRILHNQPSLDKLTRDVFLFTGQDKEDVVILGRKMQLIKRLIPTDMNPANDTQAARNLKGPQRVEQRRDGTNPPPNLNKILRMLIVSVPSLVVFYNAFYNPDSTHFLLAGLWAAMIGRTFYCRASATLLPLGQSILTHTVALFSASNAYYRPNISNVALAALWVTVCSRYLFSAFYWRQRRFNVTAWQVMSYGLVLISFWKACHSPDTDEVLQQIYRFVHLSPAILAAEGI
ncbi:uncharacterized protein LOC142097155 isoform X2 [Mixophyes fleayi]|uniref:uncharacterized protein LOC142097155 isoform X2 n=1 Tax=Mixophyes fleayi TaxID=3061075 RepID=UPI003F4D8455